MTHVIRLIVGVHLAAVLLQAASAGAFLAGTPWGTVHRTAGWLILGIATAQAGVAGAFARTGAATPLFAASSTVILLAESLQFIAGHFQMWRVHLPLGVLIFGGLVGQLALLVTRHDRLRATVAGTSRNDVVSADAGAFSRSFRRWAMFGTALVVLQIVLGIGYRLQLWDVVFHIVGALAASLVLLSLCTVIQQRDNLPRSVLGTAQIGMAVVLLQVAAGVSLWFAGLLGERGSAAGVVLAALHDVGGSLTLAASVALMIRVDTNPVER